MLDFIIASGADYDQKNIFIMTSDAGIDANDTGAMAVSANYDGIIGIGNAFLTSWSLEAAVGGIPTVTCALEGQNIVFTGGITASVAPNPSIVNGVDPGTVVTLPSGAGLFSSTTEVAAVRPGDVTLFLGTTDTDDKPMVGLSESDLKIQSASVSLTINREPIRKLGNTFAFAREITFPINCTMSVNAVVGDLANSRLFSLVNRACDDGTKYTAILTLNGYKGADCAANTAYVVLKGAKLDSQNITSSIGPNKTVTFELSAQIGKNSGLHFRSSGTA
jgi:hypothetical protein